MIYRIIRNGFGNDIGMMLIELVAFVVAIYFAIVLHEVAHGMVAKWNGDLTAQVNGRLTLNPIKHIDITGALMMLFVGIGWAKPVPIDPYNFRDRRRGLITVSLAGIITNLILCAISLGLFAAVVAIYKAVLDDLNNVGYYFILLFVRLFEYSAIINAGLAGFNLLPLYPLDGFRLVEVFTRPNNGYVRLMRRYGIYIFFVLIALSLLADITGWPCDVLGMYIGVIQKGVLAIMNAILGG